MGPRSVEWVWPGARLGRPRICYCRALKLGEASKVAPVDKLSVVLVALFAVVFPGRAAHVS